MPERDKSKDKPTQKTPKGQESPIPTRGDVLRDLDKLSRPPGKKEGKKGRRR